MESIEMNFIKNDFGHLVQFLSNEVIPDYIDFDPSGNVHGICNGFVRFLTTHVDNLEDTVNEWDYIELYSKGGRDGKWCLSTEPFDRQWCGELVIDFFDLKDRERGEIRNLLIQKFINELKAYWEENKDYLKGIV